MDQHEVLSQLLHPELTKHQHFPKPKKLTDSIPAMNLEVSILILIQKWPVFGLEKSNCGSFLDWPIWPASKYKSGPGWVIGPESDPFDMCKKKLITNCWTVATQNEEDSIFIHYQTTSSSAPTLLLRPTLMFCVSVVTPVFVRLQLHPPASCLRLVCVQLHSNRLEETRQPTFILST